MRPARAFRMSDAPHYRAHFLDHSHRLHHPGRLSVVVTYPSSGQVTEYLVQANGWRLLGYRAWRRRQRGKPGGAGWVAAWLKRSACPRETVVQGTAAADRHALALAADPGEITAAWGETAADARRRLNRPSVRLRHFQRYESEVAT